VFKYDENGSRVTDQRTGKNVFEINDHWFEVKAKFLWKDVPQEILQMEKGK
jgi:hypothetical protein